MINPIKGGSSEEIQGLVCHIPPVPQKHLIAGFDLPKKDQMWRRTELPEQWEEWREEEAALLEDDPEYVHPKIHTFVEQEWNRRLNGYWFFNNGKPTYITGKHYFYVNWWKLDSGYPDYRDTDRKLFYFWQYCIEDDKCYGMVEATMRRQGKTYRGTSDMYEEISRPPQKKSGGIQSKTGDDAKELFREKLIEPWKDLPDFFKPEHNSGSDPKSELSFFRDIERGKRGKNVKHTEDTELRSLIDWKNAKEKAYDGKKKIRLFHDEAGKTNPKQEADVYKRLRIVKPCVWANGKIVGKIYVSTTVEDLDEGGAEFKKIWDESNQKGARNKNGETPSGLYRYFLSALEGTYYNKYGLSAIEPPSSKEEKEYLLEKYGEENGARVYYQNKREDEKNKGEGEYIAHCRMFPWTEEEMFYADTNQCEFNAYVLTKRGQELEMYKNIVTTGNFEWSSKQDGDVRFDHNPVNGRFQVFFLPDTGEQNRVSIRGYHGEKTLWRPNNILAFTIGVDPVDHGAQTVEGKKSNAAAYVFRKFDLNIDRQEMIFTEESLKEDPFWDWKVGRVRWNTNLPVVQYIHRPNDPRDFYEDMIKLARFYGCKVLVENQKTGLINHFRERGYEDFLMYRPSFTFTKDGNSQDTTGIPSSTPMIQQYTERISAWVQNYGHLNPFKELNADLIRFNPARPREHDPTVAFGFTLIAAENKEDVRRSVMDLEDLFPAQRGGV